MIEETVLIDVGGTQVTSKARIEERDGLTLAVIETACGGLYKRHSIEVEGDAQTIQYNVERTRHRDAEEVGGKVVSAGVAKGLFEAGKGRSVGPVQGGKLRVPKPGPKGK